MPPNAAEKVVEVAEEAVEVADSANQLLQSIPPLRIKDPLSLKSVTNPDIWTPKWVNSLWAKMERADSKTIEQGYQKLTKQLNDMLGQPYPTDKDTQDDWASTLLLHLLVMRVYLKTAVKCSSSQLVGLQPKQGEKQQVKQEWEKQITRVIKAVPKVAYLNQLSPLVEAISNEKNKKPPIDRTVDRTLQKLHAYTLESHYKTLDLYFKQFLDWLSLNTTQNRPPPDEESSAYVLYTDMICLLHAYITQLSDLPLKEKEVQALSNRLLGQLKQLIERSSTLDLSPSWMERLKKWLKGFFLQLKSLYTVSSAAETSLRLLADISEQLRKSTKKAAKLLQSAEKVVKNKKSQSLELLRERCWLYFSLNEQLIIQWENKEKHGLKYQSTALALFESFMSTFDWPNTFKQGILHENPLKSAKSPWGWLTRFERHARSSTQVAPVEDLEHLLDPALNKLAADFFIKGWSGHRKYLNERSFIHWLVSRQELRLMAKIKDYVSTKEERFQRDEMLPFDKRSLYRFVQEIHKDICSDLNQITQMILNVWFQEVGIIVSHADLASALSKPGRWLYRKDQQGEKGAIPRLAFFLFDTIERLGAGVYFFPKFQKPWSAFQEALAARSGNVAEFVHQQNKEIAEIIRQLYFAFHPDRRPEADRDTVDGWANRYIPKTKELKEDLEKFRKRDPNELQSLDARVEAQTFLLKLKRVVLDGMHHHLSDVRWIVNALSLSPDELQLQYSQEICQYVSTVRQIDAGISAKDDIIASLRAELAAKKQQAQPQPVEPEPQAQPQAAAQEPQAQPQSIVARIWATLFYVPTTSQTSTTATDMNNPLFSHHLLR